MAQNTRTALAMLAAVAPGLVGCTVLKYAHLTSIREQELFCDKGDDRASLATYRAMADEAWASHGAACPEDCLDGDYAWGFREGFAQTVYAGGKGEPPATPPRPYWQVDLRSEAGAAAVRSWFTGYRHGARLALDGGYRRRATLSFSASLRDCDACGCPDDNAVMPPVASSPAEELVLPPVMTAPLAPEPAVAPPADEEIRQLPPPDLSPEAELEIEPPRLQTRSTDRPNKIADRSEPSIFQIVR